MELQKLSDTELVRSIEQTVASERELTGHVIEHLREVERRRLHVQLGYSSLFDYCTRSLKYCPASAQLRIDAMRLSREVPEVQAALETGAVTLSSVGVLQKWIRMEKSEKGKTYSAPEKRALFEKIEHRSKDETERVLCNISPHAVPREKERVVSPTETQIQFVAGVELLQMIEEVRVRLARKDQASPGTAEVLRYALKKALGRAVRESDSSSATASSGEVKSREAETQKAPSMGILPEHAHRPHIPRAIRCEVARKSNHRCTYVSKLTGRRCQETRALQIEHIHPYAKGGGDEPENLALLCRTHNRERVIEAYGEGKMGKFGGG